MDRGVLSTKMDPKGLPARASADTHHLETVGYDRKYMNICFI